MNHVLDSVKIGRIHSQLRVVTNQRADFCKLLRTLVIIIIIIIIIKRCQNRIVSGSEGRSQPSMHASHGRSET